MSIDRERAERHFGRDIRVLPGRANRASFHIGDGCTIVPRGEGATWGLHLQSATRGVSIEWDQHEGWSVPACCCVVVSIRPPAQVERGVLDLICTRPDDGKQAVIEFELAARAT